MSYPPWLQLRSGAVYEYGSHECPGMKFDMDVAWPIAHLARFAGHTELGWSVAAHATVCGEVAYEATHGNAGVALDAHHHDDEEALIGDCPSPLKRMLGGVWADLALAAASAVAKCSGWKVFTDIHKYDLAVLEAERRVLKPIVPTRDWEFPFDEALVRLAIPRIELAIDEGRTLGPGAYARYLALDRSYRWEYEAYDSAPMHFYDNHVGRYA